MCSSERIRFSCKRLTCLFAEPGQSRGILTRVPRPLRETSWHREPGLTLPGTQLLFQSSRGSAFQGRGDSGRGTKGLAQSCTAALLVTVTVMEKGGCLGPGPACTSGLVKPVHHNGPHLVCVCPGTCRVLGAPGALDLGMT